MKSSVIYARYDSITPRGGWVESGLIAGNGSGQRMAEQQQQQQLPWQMLKNGNAFSAPAKSLGDFKLYAAHTRRSASMH